MLDPPPLCKAGYAVNKLEISEKFSQNTDRDMMRCGLFLHFIILLLYCSLPLLAWGEKSLSPSQIEKIKRDLVDTNFTIIETAIHKVAVSPQILQQDPSLIPLLREALRNGFLFDPIGYYGARLDHVISQIFPKLDESLDIQQIQKILHSGDIAEINALLYKIERGTAKILGTHSPWLTSILTQFLSSSQPRNVPGLSLLQRASKVLAMMPDLPEATVEMLSDKLDIRGIDAKLEHEFQHQTIVHTLDPTRRRISVERLRKFAVILKQTKDKDFILAYLQRMPFTTETAPVWLGLLPDRGSNPSAKGSSHAAHSIAGETYGKVNEFLMTFHQLDRQGISPDAAKILDKFLQNAGKDLRETMWAAAPNLLQKIHLQWTSDELDVLVKNLNFYLEEYHKLTKIPEMKIRDIYRPHIISLLKQAIDQSLLSGDKDWEKINHLEFIAHAMNSVELVDTPTLQAFFEKYDSVVTTFRNFSGEIGANLTNLKIAFAGGLGPLYGENLEYQARLADLLFDADPPARSAALRSLLHIPLEFLSTHTRFRILQAMSATPLKKDAALILNVEEKSMLSTIHAQPNKIPRPPRPLKQPTVKIGDCTIEDYRGFARHSPGSFWEQMKNSAVNSNNK